MNDPAPSRSPRPRAAPGIPDTGQTSPVETGTTGVHFELSLKSMLVILAVLGGVWMLLHILPALLVLVTALMLVGALTPLVAWLEGKKVRRFFAICLVFGLGLACFITVCVLTVPTVLAQVKSLIEHEPQIRETVAGFLERSRATATLADDLRNVRVAELLKSSQAGLLTFSTRMLEIAAYGMAAIFLAFYMMLDRDRLRGAMYAVVPRSHHIRLSRIILNLGTIVGGYIRGQLLTCFLMGGFILVLLLACGVPNALAIALFGGIMDLLPYIGIFLTMGPAVLAASAKGAVVAGIVFVLMLAYEEFESRVLVPLVYGRSLRLPSSVVLFSLILGTTLAGIAGALLALPLAAAVLMLIEELRVDLPGETMQPEDIEQRREDVRSEKEYERRAESMTAGEAAAVAVEISGTRKKEEGDAELALAAQLKKDSQSGETDLK
jgi:predicted PurR-regulated permease PerM